MAKDTQRLLKQLAPGEAEAILRRAMVTADVVRRWREQEAAILYSHFAKLSNG